MRGTTTTPRGPVRRPRKQSSRPPSGRRDSQKRWTSCRGPVSIGTDPLTTNRYTYVNGDPINLVDPTGHYTELGDGRYYHAKWRRSPGDSGLRGRGNLGTRATISRAIESHVFTSEVAGINVASFASQLGNVSAEGAQQALERLAGLKRAEADRLLAEAEWLLRLQAAIPSRRSASEYLRTLARLRIDQGARDALGMALEDLGNGLARSNYRSRASAAMSSSSLALSNARTLRGLGRAAGVAGISLDLYDGWQDIRDAESRREALEAAGGTAGSIGGGAAGGAVGAGAATAGCVAVTAGSCVLAVFVVGGVFAFGGSSVGRPLGESLGGLVDDALGGYSASKRSFFDPRNWRP